MISEDPVDKDNDDGHEPPLAEVKGQLEHALSVMLAFIFTLLILNLKHVGHNRSFFSRIPGRL